MVHSSMPPQALTQAARVLGRKSFMEATVVTSHMIASDNHMMISESSYSHMSLSSGHSNRHDGGLEEDASSSGDKFVRHYQEG